MFFVVVVVLFPKKKMIIRRKSIIKIKLARTVFFAGRCVCQWCSSWLCGFMLNARFGSVQIQTTILDILIDFAGGVQKCIFHFIATGFYFCCLLENRWKIVNILMNHGNKFRRNANYENGKTYVIALDSTNINPCSSANCFASSYVTSRLLSKSDLLPIKYITVFGFVKFLVSASQLLKWLYVDRRVISYTINAPAAPR